MKLSPVNNVVWALSVSWEGELRILEYKIASELKSRHKLIAYRGCFYLGAGPRLWGTDAAFPGNDKHQKALRVVFACKYFKFDFSHNITSGFSHLKI